MPDFVAGWAQTQQEDLGNDWISLGMTSPEAQVQPDYGHLQMTPYFANQPAFRVATPPPALGGLSMFGFTGASLDWNMPFEPPEELSPLFTLTLDLLLQPQLEVFFDRIYPMLPIFSRAEIMARIEDPQRVREPTTMALILAMVALSLIHPLMPEELAQKTNRIKRSKMLMDEACRLRGKWDYGCRPSVEAILTSYLMFGTLFELGQADGARFRLKEAISLGEAMRLDRASAYQGLDQDECQRRMRMFWVLAVTERVISILRRLNGSSEDLFGVGFDIAGVGDVQRADLLITWQWLRNRIWRLAALHGLTVEGQEYELSAAYVIDVATATVSICRKLSLRVMEAHGTGFVEKLYDIAAVVSELLQSNPSISAELLIVAQTDQWNQLLQDLQFYVTRHGAGTALTAPMAQAVNVVSTIRMLREI
ncbi:hypothetical protein IAU60_004752 [Kwoniella sp. DSM 27419]